MANKPPNKHTWQQIEEDTNSFEEVLLRTSKIIPVKAKYLSYTRAIEQAYKARKPFTLKEWQKLHEIAISLWYQQYSSSSSPFNFEYFAKRFMARYQRILNLLINTNTKFYQLQESSIDREHSLKVWQEFMSELCHIRENEKKASKPKKVRLDADTTFAIFAGAALLVGIALAILVTLHR